MVMSVVLIVMFWKLALKMIIIVPGIALTILITSGAVALPGDPPPIDQVGMPRPVSHSRD